jgi:hypothetical protein
MTPRPVGLRALGVETPPSLVTRVTDTDTYMMQCLIPLSFSP